MCILVFGLGVYFDSAKKERTVPEEGGFEEAPPISSYIVSERFTVQGVDSNGAMDKGEAKHHVSSHSQHVDMEELGSEWDAKPRAIDKKVGRNESDTEHIIRSCSSAVEELASEDISFCLTSPQMSQEKAISKP